MPVCCAPWPDEGTWVSHPLSLTRICNLRGRSSSPNIPIAHGDDQVTLWKPNGTAFPDIRRGKGEEITLWKALGAMEKAIYYVCWQYLKAFGENNINFGKKSASTAMCFGYSLLGILLRDYVGCRVVLVGIFGLSAHFCFWRNPKCPSGASLQLSDDVRALKRKLFWLQKCKISVWELYELAVVWVLVPAENPALGKSWITRTNPIECTGPSSVYKITDVLIFQRTQAKDIDHACWTSNWLTALCLNHANFISCFKQMFDPKSSDLNRNEVSFMSWIKILWNSWFLYNHKADAKVKPSGPN